MKPLPAGRWEYAERKRATVSIDYHIELDRRLYSVPYQLVAEKVDVRFTASVVEIFHGGRRVCTHQRLWTAKGTASTLEAHRPKIHRAYGAWSPSRVIEWARAAGPGVGALVEHLLQNRPHPETAYRACMALIRDAKGYPPERFSAACLRAIEIGSPTRYSVRSILKRGLDKVTIQSSPELLPGPWHDNVRGAEYYDRKELEHDGRRDDHEVN
jgi:hypothetical protein